MTVPMITHSSVRKLAALLGEVNSSSLKNSERIELIASSMGWRGDALMHALKAAERSLDTSEMASAIASLGLRGIESWIPALVSKSTGAYFLVSGAWGNRAAGTCSQLLAILEGGGRRDLGDPVKKDEPLPKGCKDGVIVIRNDGGNIGAALRYASAGAIVLMPMNTNSFVDSLHHVCRWIDRKGMPGIEFVRGVSVQRRLGGSGDDRVTASDFYAINSHEQRSAILATGDRGAPWFDELGVACDALNYAKSGRLSIDTVTRAFGKDIEDRIKEAVKAYPEYATKLGWSATPSPPIA
jgi:hypothetical protein